MIQMTSKAMSKFLAYIKFAEGEISGLGEVGIVENKGILVTDLILFAQETSDVLTDLSFEKVADFYEEAIESGTSMENIRLWWHSHGKSDVFWSQTDELTIEALKGSQWLVSIVGNKHGHFLARLDIFRPFRLTINDLPLLHVETGDAVEESSLQIEVKSKVSYTPTSVKASIVLKGSVNDRDKLSKTKGRSIRRKVT